MARPVDIRVDVKREREIVADARRRQVGLEEVIGHVVLEAAVLERGDLDGQRAPDLAGVVEPQ
jgi:hypothetical protein